MKRWNRQELVELERISTKKPAYVTDYQLSAQLANHFGTTPESVRWQLRQFRRDVVEVKPPKVLLLDIETLPIEALVWDTWKQNIYIEQIKKDWSVLCWSAKWLFDTKVMGQRVSEEEARNHEDYSVLEKVWNLMNEADMIIWHNGEAFDAKKLNARFFLNGFPKPMYYKSIDTKKVAVEVFDFTYSKLDWIAKILGVGRKIETEFKWWAECEKGDTKYLNMMLKYNKWDINLEEEVYLKLRPWMDKHPNMNLYANAVGNVCPCCGDNDLHWNGTYSTPLGLYKAFRCQTCGAIGRSTKKQFKLKASEVQ